MNPAGRHRSGRAVASHDLCGARTTPTAQNGNASDAQDWLESYRPHRGRAEGSLLFTGLREGPDLHPSRWGLPPSEALCQRPQPESGGGGACRGVAEFEMERRLTRTGSSCAAAVQPRVERWEQVRTEGRAADPARVGPALKGRSAWPRKPPNPTLRGSGTPEGVVGSMRGAGETAYGRDCVRTRGLEPPPQGDRDLNPARLPISPRPRHSHTNSPASDGRVPDAPSWPIVSGHEQPSETPRITAAGTHLDPSSHVYQRLLKERIVFLGSAIDQDTANLICAQLMLLEAEDPDRTSRSTSTRRADR